MPSKRVTTPPNRVQPKAKRTCKQSLQVADEPKAVRKPRTKGKTVSKRMEEIGFRPATDDPAEMLTDLLEQAGAEVVTVDGPLVDDDLQFDDDEPGGE